MSAYDLDFEGVKMLLASAGHAGDPAIRRIEGGGNNRSFIVTISEQKFFLKEYFFDPDDPRDRLDTERRFCRFAWDHGISVVPEPLAFDSERHLGLFRFIEGKRPTPSEVDAAMVQDAISFFLGLNSFRTAPDSANLRPGSEAAFSIPDHIAIVDKRVCRLLNMNTSDQVDREASTFVRARLLPAWQRMVSIIEREDTRVLAPLDIEDRCISPSDFGFHNVLISSDNTVFLDFEYAGWDDPARTVADFFHQPAVPVPWSYLDQFVTATASLIDDSDLHRKRVMALLDIYGIKWCCIIMNLFLPEESRRRGFATDPETVSQQKSGKLLLAADLLTQVLARSTIGK